MSMLRKEWAFQTLDKTLTTHLSSLAQYFQPLHKFEALKRFLPFILILFSSYAKAQKIESIHVDLYTDSLKKGTFNYINIDGKLSNGKYLPLDSTDLIFWASDGKFTGNDLWIERDFTSEKVDIKVTLKSNPSLHKEFTIYVKQQPDPELKSKEELMREMEGKTKSKKG